MEIFRFSSFLGLFTFFLFFLGLFLNLFFIFISGKETAKMEKENYLTIKEAMLLLNVKSPATILKAIKEDQLYAIKIGAQWRLSREQFNKMGVDK